MHHNHLDVYGNEFVTLIIGFVKATLFKGSSQSAINVPFYPLNAKLLQIFMIEQIMSQ